MEEKVDPSRLRVIERYIFCDSNNQSPQRLVIYLEGVLGVRDRMTGQWMFREGVREGLLMIRSKVCGNLRVTLVASEYEWKAFKIQLCPILFEELGITDLVDELVVLNNP